MWSYFFFLFLTLSKICTYPEWAKVLAKSLWTHHIPHTPSLNYYRRVDAAELWAPERPGTETVSFPKQSIPSTLDIKRGTHNTIIQLFIHHTCLFCYLKICTCQTSHIIVCIVYCILCFCTLPILYIIIFIICVLSYCCLSVALWSFCRYNKFLVCVNMPGNKALSQSSSSDSLNSVFVYTTAWEPLVLKPVNCHGPTGGHTCQ